MPGHATGQDRTQREGPHSMTVLMYTVGVLLFVFGVAASIGLHECGHMVPAKKFGV